MAERIVVIRHGRTASNAAGVWQGQLDTPLDEVGRAQAAATAAVLGRGPAPDRLVCSDLGRALATADPLAEAWAIPAEPDPRLREVDAGAWEGLSRAQIAEQWPDELAAWQAGRDVRIGGAERVSEAGARVRTAILEFADSAPTLVVVGHGGALRSATEQLVGLDDAVHQLGVLRNAHWGVLLVGRTGGWYLDTWNAGPT